MTILLNFDVIYYIGEFMSFYDRIAPISKRLVKYHLLRKNMKLYSWKSKRLVFTYLTMYGTVAHTWLTWGRFAKKQLHLSRRSRNSSQILSWKAAVIRKMTCNTCQGCGKSSIASVFGTCICTRCRALPFRKNCYMITTCSALNKAQRYGVPYKRIREIPFHKMGQCRLRFYIKVQQAIANYGH